MPRKRSEGRVHVGAFVDPEHRQQLVELARKRDRSLSSIVRWEQKLELGIDECDLFMLFWSSEAKKSAWVRREVRYALERQAGDQLAPPEIAPIPIEDPPPKALEYSSTFTTTIGCSTPLAQPSCAGWRASRGPPFSSCRSRQVGTLLRTDDCGRPRAAPGPREDTDFPSGVLWLRGALVPGVPLARRRRGALLTRHCA